MSGRPLRRQRATQTQKEQRNIKENRSKPKTLTTGGKRKNRRIGPEADHFYCCPHKVYWLSRGIVSQTKKTDTQQKKKKKEKKTD